MSPFLYVMQRCTDAQKQRILQAAGADFTVRFRDELPLADQARAMARATAVFGEPTLERVHQMPNLRWIQMTWAGADRYTKAPDFPRQILVSNATGAYGVTIAEYLFGVILALYRHQPIYTRNQDLALWQSAAPSRGLEGKRVLILGAGDIGTAFAKRLKAFDAVTVGVRRTVREKPDVYDEMYALTALDAQLPLADIVVGCLPSTAETAGLFDEKRLRRMKPDAVLANVGRGSLIVTDDLVTVMQSGHLFAAALDVCDPEPLPKAHPLWKLPNVLLTPHVAGIGFGNVPETSEKIIAICCENLRRIATGQTPGNLVDFQLGYRANK